MESLCVRVCSMASRGVCVCVSFLPALLYMHMWRVCVLNSKQRESEGERASRKLAAKYDGQPNVFICCDSLALYAHTHMHMRASARTEAHVRRIT